MEGVWGTHPSSQSGFGVETPMPLNPKILAFI
jgi:hypothetical protein